MKAFKPLGTICCAGLLILTTASCKKNNSSIPEAEDSSNITRVTIQSMQFQPASVTVLPGSKITWTNMDADMHSVMSDDNTSFNSGNISSQGSFTFTAGQPGLYPYHCAIHPGMKGTLIVATR
ncbi:cupredoxin domain-containing protein [Ferruginibacter profundus]